MNEGGGGGCVLLASAEEGKTFMTVSYIFKLAMFLFMFYG